MNMNILTRRTRTLAITTSSNNSHAIKARLSRSFFKKTTTGESHYSTSSEKKIDDTRTTTTTTPISSKKTTTKKTACGGAGIGNVKDQMLPATKTKETKHLYRFLHYPKTVSVIGAPMTHGQPFVGSDKSPDLLREAGLLHHLESLEWNVNDTGDLDFDHFLPLNEPNDYAPPPTIENPNYKHSTIVGQGCEMIAHAIQTEIKAGKFPLVLGGDHSIAAGSIAGILSVKPNTGVIWVDAHADLNSPQSSTSGNMHGMPVGLLMKEVMMHQDPVWDIPGFEWLNKAEMKKARLKPDSIVYVGLRDVDPAERRVIRDLGIRVFTMHDIDRYGIGEVMDRALNHLLERQPERSIHISYDIDAVDPVHAPATGTAVRGGLTYREAHYVCEAVANTGALASADIVELNPSLADDEGGRETIELGLGLITSLMGKSII